MLLLDTRNNKSKIEENEYTVCMLNFNKKIINAQIKLFYFNMFIFLFMISYRDNRKS